MSNDLLVNPNFWLESRNIGHGVMRANVFAPVKGRGLQSYFADMKQNPEVYRLVTEIQKARDAGTALPEVDERHRPGLYQMGVLVRKEEISQPVYFRCFLDESVLEWIPERCRRDLLFDESPSLIVNPSFVYQEGAVVPEAIAHKAQIYARFLPGSPLVWIENPGTRLLTAYWVGEKEREAVSRFQAGRSPAFSLSPAFRRILEMARILVPPEYPERCAEEWEKFIAECRADFQSRSFAVFSDLVPPFYLGALRRYFAEVIAEGYVQGNDPLLPARAIRHHEDMACFLHHQLAYLMSRIAGRPLKPSHDYLFSYEGGAILERHVDINEEEYAVSLLLNYDPDPLGASPWPLYLDIPEKGPVAIIQEFGNAVFYNGAAISHFRPPLPMGHRSTSLVLHYVPQIFRGL